MKDPKDLYGDPIEFFVTRTEEKDYSFRGWLLGEVHQEDENKTLRIYKTVGGNFIAKESNGQKTKAVACTSTDSVISFFGLSTLAKKLYQEVGLDYYERIE